jgi:hypothetical protein
MARFLSQIVAQENDYFNFEPCRRQNLPSGEILGKKAMRATLEWHERVTHSVSPSTLAGEGQQFLRPEEIAG